MKCFPSRARAHPGSFSRMTISSFTTTCPFFIHYFLVILASAYPHAWANFDHCSYVENKSISPNVGETMVNRLSSIKVETRWNRLGALIPEVVVWKEVKKKKEEASRTSAVRFRVLWFRFRWFLNVLRGWGWFFISCFGMGLLGLV